MYFDEQTPRASDMTPTKFIAEHSVKFMVIGAVLLVPGLLMMDYDLGQSATASSIWLALPICIGAIVLILSSGCNQLYEERRSTETNGKT